MSESHDVQYWCGHSRSFKRITIQTAGRIIITTVVCVVIQVVHNESPHKKQSTLYFLKEAVAQILIEFDAGAFIQ